jgi:hypothetical protein
MNSTYRVGYELVLIKLAYNQKILFFFSFSGARDSIHKTLQHKNHLDG